VGVDDSKVGPHPHIVFFKYFDRILGSLEPLIHLNVDLERPVTDHLSKLKEVASLPDDATLELFEEVRPTRIDPVEPSKCFKELRIEHGDIIIYQLADPYYFGQSSS